jgi:hypothetical protein
VGLFYVFACLSYVTWELPCVIFCVHVLLAINADTCPSSYACRRMTQGRYGVTIWFIVRRRPLPCCDLHYACHVQCTGNWVFGPADAWLDSAPGMFPPCQSEFKPPCGDGHLTWLSTASGLLVCSRKYPACHGVHCSS